MNSGRVNPGRVRLTPVGSGYGEVLTGWAGAGSSWANGRDAWVKRKMGRPAGPVRGGVGFRPKIENRIGKLFHFQRFI
jgi:hypothetical protein